jgi:hypothetical protein
MKPARSLVKSPLAVLSRNRRQGPCPRDKGTARGPGLTPQLTVHRCARAANQPTSKSRSAQAARRS